MNVLLKINGLSVAYETQLVINNLSYEAGAGIHGIIGPNGCGKSTFLKTIAGILPTQQGQIVLKGIDLAIHTRAFKQCLCYVPDKPAVYPFMTGRQYLQMIASVKKASMDTSLMEWIKNIRLMEYLDKPFSAMSFGTRRKFMLSAVLIASPTLLLLDEPFNGLDSHTKSAFSTYLQGVQNKACILIASHGLEDENVNLASQLSFEH
ncbi:ATP-binding cassette domain-containing protein [Marinicella sp. W31]|uniref:ABC transporter ATP-binding protein n=1 Tax=Marinicella sp. W31 TaxID=3023713 RepID=UPI003756417A